MLPKFDGHGNFAIFDRHTFLIFLKLHHHWNIIGYVWLWEKNIFLSKTTFYEMQRISIDTIDSFWKREHDENIKIFL